MILNNLHPILEASEDQEERGTSKIQNNHTAEYYETQLELKDEIIFELKEKMISMESKMA